MRRFSTAPCYTHNRLAYRYRKREPNWFPLTAFGGERGINTFSNALRNLLIFKFCLFSSSLNICIAWRRYVAKNMLPNH